ncbi:AzlD domain-containing protein [Streptosporangium amethystogenes subsp. fukuiense]|uniref:AzlD domain-containing protein n=1 Tax=Streptosporangium amethystogenes subsp. fukuiense TaxID=698418 RepID=A0ABW2T7K6_9ACTN
MTNTLKQLMTTLQTHDPASHVRADPLVLSATLQSVIADTAREPRKTKPRWSWQRWLTLIPVTALLVGAAVIMPIIMHPNEIGPMTLGPAKALAFTRNGDYIDVRIVDPDADPERYRQDFAAHGLNVELKTEPASPSLVGAMISVSSPQRTVVFHSDGFEIKDGNRSPRIKKIEGTDCGKIWCLAGVSIPVGLRSPFEVTFGRAARLGERYEITGDPTARGEILEGMKLANKTVGEVRIMLQRRHATVSHYYKAPPEPSPRDGSGLDVTEHPLQAEDVPDTWYVHEALGGHEKNAVRLIVAPQPTANPH